MSFESSDASVVKSIQQRYLLNVWIRLFAAKRILPDLASYRPDRIEDERPDLVHYIVDHAHEPARFVIDSNGTRMASAYGTNGKGRYLDDYLGPILGPAILPAYHACLAHRLPTYTVSMIDDVNGHAVAYERMLMPFSDVGSGKVTHILASLKTISEDGSFEIRNLMRGHHSAPTPKLGVVIDRNFSASAPSRMAAGDLVASG